MCEVNTYHVIMELELQFDSGIMKEILYYYVYKHTYTSCKESIMVTNFLAFKMIRAILNPNPNTWAPLIAICYPNLQFFSTKKQITIKYLQEWNL